MRLIVKPRVQAQIAIINGGMNRSLRSTLEQPSQNLRLVHTRQRSRTIFVPQFEQKFGRYMVKAPGEKAVRSSWLIKDGL